MSDLPTHDLEFLLQLPEAGSARKFIANPKAFSSGRKGWYTQIQVSIDGKIYKGSIMLYGEKP